MKKFNGIHTALITPFKADGSIDFEALGKIIEEQIGAGISGLVVTGSTGESFSLSLEEKSKIFEYAINVINKRCLVIGNIAGMSMTEIEDSIRVHEKYDFDAVLLAPMPYIKPTQDGIKSLYREVKKLTSIEIILYNVPSRHSVDVSNSTIIELHQEKTINIVKEASGDIGRLTELSKYPDLQLLSGEDSNLIGFMANGGIGSISVLSNVAPFGTMNAYNLFKSGNVANALDQYSRFSELMDALFIESNPIPVKYLMSKKFDFCNKLRLPLTSLRKTKESHLDSFLGLCK